MSLQRVKCPVCGKEAAISRIGEIAPHSPPSGSPESMFCGGGGRGGKRCIGGVGGGKRFPDLVMKKNPAKFGYFLRVQKNSKGPVLTWNGKSFSDRTDSKPHLYPSIKMATERGRALHKLFPVLRGYKLFVESSDSRKSGLKKNPIRRTPKVESQLSDAAQKLEDFSGHPVQHLESGYSRSDQSTGLIIGEIDLIGYRAKRDGKTERYGHHFKKKSRPLLAVTSDGKQLHIVGGQYEFTEAGIEDR